MRELDQLGPLEFHFGDGLPDAIERILHDAICDGTLKPGLRLREQDLAARFEVSSTPIREAIRRLAHNGLVELLPRRGATVTNVTWEEVAELLELREILESHVVRKVASADPPEERLAELEAVLDEMSRHLDDPTPVAFLTLDTEFHVKLVRLAGNRPLEQADEITQRQLKRARAVLRHPLTRARGIKDSHQQHLDIVAAIRAKDPDRAEGALRAHVSSVRDSLRTLFADFEADNSDPP